ncbi:hypothetical protein KF201_2023 [Lactococcus lactis subsp. lactis]|nr:hypothetical protein KF201_2023 [Lactococcus lactis subsp. lactis]
MFQIKLRKTNRSRLSNQPIRSDEFICSHNRRLPEKILI